MGRVKLNLPEIYCYSTDIDITVNYINYGGHVGNDSILSIAHESRIRFFKNYGFSELNTEGVGLVISDSIVVYNMQAFHGDKIKIEISLEDFQRVSVDMLYKLTNKETNEEIARVKTGIVFYDFKYKKVMPIPLKFKELFQ